MFRYEPITIHELPNRELREYSEVTSLYYYWREGRLDWYAPDAEDYIPSQETERRRSEAAEQRAEQERQRADARIRELEARLAHGEIGA